MTFIEWDDSLNVQVKEIDDQHKNLIITINKAHEISSNEDKEKILNNLIEFTRVHFSTEEKYFKKFKFEGTEEHMQEHADLILKVLKYKDLFDESKCDWNEFLNFLKNWLEDHLKELDQKYVKCFKENGLK